MLRQLLNRAHTVEGWLTGQQLPAVVSTCRFLHRSGPALLKSCRSDRLYMSALVDVFLRRSVQDRPVVFDPSIRFMGDKLDGIGPNADGVYEFGRLAVGRELVKLTDIWGLSPLPKA